jgi:hypothetical protein
MHGWTSIIRRGEIPDGVIEEEERTGKSDGLL